ncbi:hypothetical protein [Calothrix sp. NIES-2100]|uniref:hypothetical protein n=1 Tax=Calothrix sp. NIES-2100 TaxID=1954172 RepID=UPI0030DBBA95
MSDIKIDAVICARSGSILIVFYSTEKCWQFRIISHTGGIFGLEQIYYTYDAALKAGREWLLDEVMGDRNSRRSYSHSDSQVGKVIANRAVVKI